MMHAVSSKRTKLFCVAAFVLAVASSAPAQTRKIQLDDAQKIVRLSDPQISPDGKSIALLVARVNWKDDKTDQSLVLIDAASGAQRPLTDVREGVGSPRWSPTGDRIAFIAVAGQGKDAQEQIFVLPMNGGEAKQITKTTEGVEQFAWKPDGSAIAYVTPDEPANKKEIEAHNDAFEVGDNDYLATAAPAPSHIWIVGADGANAARLTSGTWSLSKSASPSPPSSPLSWSPDGKNIAFTRQAKPEFGDADQTTINILDVTTRAIRPLTDRKSLEGFATFSPDGTQIAYWYSLDGNATNQTEIFVAPAAGGEGKDVTRGIDRDIQRAIWMADGKSLLVAGHDGTGTSMWIQPADGGAAKKLDLGGVNPAWRFWVDASVSKEGAIAFTGATTGRPSELYYIGSASEKPRRLTDFNSEIAGLQLGQTESLEWKGPNGFNEDGVVVYPPDFSKDKKYPLVLLIHGGPQASSTAEFSFIPQILASHGYVVFEPNYRGSDNLGNAYQFAIYNDAGDGPGRDVMAGLAALEKQGFIDTDKIGVSGWSYGGYMTSWLIGHYTIWKAAISGAAVNSNFYSYNLSDNNVGERYSFGGSPWVGDFAKEYAEQSPITYWKAIKTPTLILHDTGDARVPITNSYDMYHALKDNGVTVQFIAYPVSGHFPGDPVRATDVMRRWVEWMDKYLK
jgi:dipeptidyl aminopeptidase/acylaminoacyl peptidase